jgi:hypothetical protein
MNRKLWLMIVGNTLLAAGAVIAITAEESIYADARTRGHADKH